MTSPLQHATSRDASPADPPGSVDLLAALRRYWGFDSFRPRQEAIVRSLLAGRDVCVVMPTGGGKSLCYQLPAAILKDRTVVVVSPLIALMQDQVAQLTDMGIPAAVLNSSLTTAEQSAVMLKATRGEYRLLYLSPERLASPDSFGWLQRLPLAFFAIDEAHCISEWGHEFRPEYRKLKLLRERFPECPLAAFTASATRRVRHDILDQLGLRQPHKSIASFHRPNLRYLVQQCPNEPTQWNLLLRILRHHSGSNVIIYAPTIARVEGLVAQLEEHGVAAVPYHGKMESDKRRENQERWMSDDVPVIVGTIAFGLGINKPAVRAVVHLSLPKSLEQYYQEAGRAGRDDRPADCVLLWQPRDAALLAYFINKIEDPAERERAWKRYHDIHDFVQSSHCRQRQVCTHFGENPKWSACGTCDVCGETPKWLIASGSPLPRQKPGVRSIYGGKASAGKMSGGKPLSVSEGAGGAITSPADAALYEYLREWRQKTARKEKVPAFVVMHDATLEELCQMRPASRADLRRVPGIGERKLERYGTALLHALQAFADGARAVERTARSNAAQETLKLLEEGRTLEEIAALRDRRIGAVVSLVANLIERGEINLDARWVDPERRASIAEVATRLGTEFLKPIKDALPEEISYDEIRLVAAELRRQRNSEEKTQNSGIPISGALDP